MHGSRSRILALAMGIPLLLALLAACGGSGTGSNSPTPSGGTTTGTIKIATELPVSGGDTSSGKPTENGAHLAIDEANAANAIPGYSLSL
jgi:branched-chain amino acid transport system substrate-binding protein